MKIFATSSQELRLDNTKGGSQAAVPLDMGEDANG